MKVQLAEGRRCAVRQQDLHTVVSAIRELKDLGKRTLVMGIVNVTPDSFSDGGTYFSVARAVAHAREMAQAGADIIDIGAESTRPQATPLGAEEEWARLTPVLSRIRDVVDVPLSIDTYKAEIANRALACGVDIVNDVWGGLGDSRMNVVVAHAKAYYVMMHNGFGSPPVVGDIVAHVRAQLTDQISAAIIAGVPPERIIIDPGVGFGKTLDQNLALVNRLDELKTLGYPLLVGTSRKSFIGHVLSLPVDQRLEGTAATVAIAIARGVDIVRVHDVASIARIVRMTDSLVR